MFGAGISFSDNPDSIYSRVLRMFGSEISCGDTTKASAPFLDIGGDRADRGDLPSLWITIIVLVHSFRRL